MGKVITSGAGVSTKKKITRIITKTGIGEQGAH